MNLSEVNAKRGASQRPIVGMAAALLPFEQDGSIALLALESCLEETAAAGLVPAVNMDTGYVNLLTPPERRRVLEIACGVLGKGNFVAGAFVEGQNGDITELYRAEVAQINHFGGTPILFQTSRLHDVPTDTLVQTYAAAVADVPKAYAFELGKMFAPNGEIWSPEKAEGIMSIPQIQGMKHSSLDRVNELERLELRDRVRPDFEIFTGNDLGIDMIEFGSSYLLGLAAFSPAKFAERDRLWNAQDTGYFAVADGLQHLGNIAFRRPVPAYKHSAATFLHLLGKIPTDQTHPSSPRRPFWEREILRSCAVRLGLL